MKKKYFFPLGGQKHLEKLQSWGYPPNKFKFPFPFFGIDSWGFGAWTLDWDLGSGLSIKGELSLTNDHVPHIYCVCQFTEKPASERMAETRWSWETNIDTGIERMVTENYAFMGATQSMYLRSGNETRQTRV